MSIVVTSWVDLSRTPITHTFVNEEHSLAFFTMVHTRDEGTRVEIDVIAGAAVEVNVYADSCSLRTTQTQYWCFKGVRCDIPLPKRGNVGSYFSTTIQDAPEQDTTLRIVVRGFDSVFNIRYFSFSFFLLFLLS